MSSTNIDSAEGIRTRALELSIHSLINDPCLNPELNSTISTGSYLNRAKDFEAYINGTKTEEENS